MGRYGEPRSEFCPQYGADYSGDIEAVIGREDVDGFIICAENTRHLPLLQAAIPAGKPIFCEKPFTTTVAEAGAALEQMVKCCGENKTLQVQFSTIRLIRLPQLGKRSSFHPKRLGRSHQNSRHPLPAQSPPNTNEKISGPR